MCKRDCPPSERMESQETLSERLLAAGDRALPGEPCALYYDAAYEIERLSGEVEKLRQRLRLADAALRSQEP